MMQILSSLSPLALEHEGGTAVAMAVVARGADMDYWDIVGHLYPSEFVEKEKRRAEEAEAVRMQTKSMESIMMIKTGDRRA